MNFLSLLRNSALSGALLLGLCAPRAQAATFTVTTTADSGAGSLRAAILDANATAPADTISFDSRVRGTLTLTSGEIIISSDLTLSGPGASGLTLSGGGTQRLFNITKGQVSLQNLTLSQGCAMGANGLDGTQSASSSSGSDSAGGAIFNQATLTLSSVTFSQNSAVGGTGGKGQYKHPSWENGTGGHPNGGAGGDARGGAIFNTGNLNLIQANFTGNKAIGGDGGEGRSVPWSQAVKYGVGGRGGNAYGGAIYNSGVIAKGSTTPSTGSTFTANQAIGGQGGEALNESLDGEPGTGYSNDIWGNSPVLAYVKGPDGTTATATGQPQTVASPLNGQSAANTFVTFTTKIRDGDGNADLDIISFYLGSGASQLRVNYNAQKNLLYIAGPNGASASVAPGSSDILTVSTGALDCAGTKVGRSGSDLSIIWKLKITTTTSTLQQTLKLRAQDRSGNLSSLLGFGTWTFTSSTDTPVPSASLSLSPSGASS